MDYTSCPVCHSRLTNEDGVQWCETCNWSSAQEVGEPIVSDLARAVSSMDGLIRRLTTEEHSALAALVREQWKRVKQEVYKRVL